MTRHTSRTTWALLAVVLTAQVAVLVWHHGRETTEPHEVPVAIQGPAVVAQSVAQRLNRLSGEPVRAVVLGEDDDPTASVRDGSTVAALVVDLRAAKNVLHVSSVNDPEMTGVMRTMATRASKPMGRTFVVREVAPLENKDLDRTTVARVGGLWVASGFLLAVVWALVGRRRRTSPVPGLRSSLLLAAACVGSSLVVATVLATKSGGSFVTWWAVGFVATYATAVAATALEVLLGLVGVALASTVFLFLAAPLMSGRDPRLLPGFWWEVAPWTLHGATNEIATSVSWFGESVPLRPALFLGGVVALALVVLLTANGLQGRATDRGRPVDAVPWRLKVLAIAVPMAMALLAATLAAPDRATVVSAERVPGSSEMPCVATPKVSNLEQLNEFVGSLRGGAAFQGADVGADVGLQDGRRLWVFGDTLRAPGFDGQRFVRNSMLVLGQGCAQAVLPADKGAIVPDRRDGVGYWPMSIARVQREGYDLVGVATQRVHGTDAPDGAFAFEALGSSIAVFVVPRGAAPQLLEQRDIGKDDKNPANPQWGAAAAVTGGWVYLYGTARPDEKGVFGFSLRVARTRIDSLLDDTGWQYWDGRAWQGRASRAAELIAADQGVSQTLSVFPRNGRWYAVSKRDEVFGSDLVVWSAPSPTGPFDAGTVVGEVPTDLKTGQLRYMPLAHPDLIPDPATVLVSYSRNNTDVKKIESNPFLYRPQFLRVTLPTAPAR